MRNLNFRYGSYFSTVAVKGMALSRSSGRRRAGGRWSRLLDQLLDLDDHELCRLERGERDQDVDLPGVDAGLGVVGRVAGDAEGVVRLAPLERAGSEEREHEGVDI